MEPLQRYQQLLERQALLPDPEQANVVNALQKVYLQLHQYQQQRGWWWPFAKTRVRGLYLWGPVGVGKTCLMDIFYQALPSERKMRIHFHRFMRQIHVRLRELQGVADPVRVVAKELAGQVSVLCFDEFFVNDIVDAMLLGHLLQALFEHGVVLVATSNVVPDHLYQKGLQRQRFLPAIELIKQHMQVLQVKGQQDYRLRVHERAATYYCPVDKETGQRLRQHFLSLATGDVSWHQPLTLESRPLKPMAYASDTIWFKFADLVDIPRSQRDYLELAQCFQTVFVSDIPRLTDLNINCVCNFIKLVDIFYDANVKLILQAAVPVEQLYSEGRMLTTFARTLSRLTEMQTTAYLGKPHLPTGTV